MRFRRLALVFLLPAIFVACSKEPAPKPSEQPTRRDENATWYLKSISDDGKTINIVYTVSGVASDCERPGSAFADESADKVAVFATKSVTLDRNKACTEELGYIDRSVKFNQPLGSRALVGCRPESLKPSEDAICRDLERSRNAGIFDIPTASPLPGE